MKKPTAFWLSAKSLLPGQVKKHPSKIKVINLSVILFLFLFLSCQKEMENLSIPSKPDGNTLKSVAMCETPLIAAQNYTAGTVTATFNAAGNQLTITYSTLNTDYCLKETHLDVQVNPANFPQTKSGNPKVGQFAYGATLECVSEWTQIVNLTTVAGWTLGNTVYIAAHAVVKKSTGGNETAWAQGTPFPGNNWAMYFFCLPAFSCGDPITVNHMVSKGIAPVDKTVTYGTVTNIPGEISKCWITSNLGASHQATAVNDATEASAGWYWQFNRKQGYKYDGIIRTPNTTWINPIDENFDWQASNDPCALELANGWRLPAFTEWYDVNATGSWTNWNGPWNSDLKLHAAGMIYGDGSFAYRGTGGMYWSSTQYSLYDDMGRGFIFDNSLSSCMYVHYKTDGFSVRCIKDN